MHEIKRLTPRCPPHASQELAWDPSQAAGLQSQGLTKQQNKLRGLGPRANYTYRETAACRRS
jgi:hypothetical protein